VVEQDLLDDMRKPMNFVDEKDIASFQMSEDADQVSPLFDGRPRGGDDANSQFCGDDMGKGGLSQSWRRMKKVCSLFAARPASPSPNATHFSCGGLPMSAPIPLSDTLEWLGYTLDRQSLTPGATLTLVTYWRVSDVTFSISTTTLSSSVARPALRL
jgi:hypothetical protein